MSSGIRHSALFFVMGETTAPESFEALACARIRKIAVVVPTRSGALKVRTTHLLQLTQEKKLPVDQQPQGYFEASLLAPFEATRNGVHTFFQRRLLDHPERTGTRCSGKIRAFTNGCCYMPDACQPTFGRIMS